MKKILALVALLCSLTILAPSAFAYCVYNQSNYPGIWVRDTKGHVGGFSPGMTAYIRFGDRACCKASSPGCDGANIMVDATFKNTMLSTLAEAIRNL